MPGREPALPTEQRFVRPGSATSRPALGLPDCSSVSPLHRAAALVPAPAPSSAAAPAAERCVDDVRRDLAALCRRMYERGYVVATDGNVSARLGPDRLLVTRTGLCLGEARPEDLVVTTALGEPVDSGAARPTSEVRLHATIYEARPEVCVICHAHPPTAVAFSLAGEELATCVLPEVVIGIGKVATTPYATPTTQATADAVRGLIRDCDALILDRHGSVTLGRTATQAFQGLERLEWAARVTLMARQLGRVQSLPKEEVERLLAVRRQVTGEPRREPCNLCGACVTP